MNREANYAKTSEKKKAKILRDMSLRKKVFIYSIGIALVFSIVFSLYTIVMLPGLYEENMNKIEVEEAVRFHKELVKKGTEVDSLKLPSSNITGILFSKKEQAFSIVDGFGKYEVDIQDEEMRNLYMQIVGKVDSLKEADWKSLQEDKDKKTNFDIIKFLDINAKDVDNATSKFNNLLRIKLQGKNHLKLTGSHQGGSVEFKSPENNIYIITATYKEKGVSYINRFIISDKADSFVVTMAPMINRGFNHIAEIVGKSLPMVLVLIVLLSYLSTKVFSKIIVEPIVRLQRDTRLISETLDRDNVSIAMDREDEIGVLSRDIQNFYQRLKKQYELLLEENEKREIVLRSFSHKLKTPIAASIMIIDAMIDNIGDFRENPEYLAELRGRIIETQKSIDRLLRLEYKTQLTVSPISPADILLNNLKKYSKLEKSRKVSWKVEGEAIWNTDREILEDILDNLVSNCFKHSLGDFQVNAHVDEVTITLTNWPASVPEDLLGSVFEPFVSRVSDKGSGLGLYIARYNAMRIGATISLENVDGGVRIVLAQNSGADDG